MKNLSFHARKNFEQEQYKIYSTWNYSFAARVEGELKKRKTKELGIKLNLQQNTGKSSVYV